MIRKRRAWALALSAVIAASSVCPQPHIPLQVYTAYAEEAESPSAVISTNISTGLDGADVSVRNEDGDVLAGSVSVQGSDIIFTADGKVETEDTFYLYIEVPGYRPISGEAFVYKNGIRAELEKKPVGKASFVYADQEAAVPDSISFAKDGAEVPFSKEEGGYALEDVLAGDSVSYIYSITRNGKEYTSEGTFYVKEEDFTVALDMTNVAEKEAVTVEGSEISLTYGDRDVSLKDFITVTNADAGDAVFEVVEGDDVVEIKDGGISTVSSGDALIKAYIPETETTLYAETEIKVHAAKRSLGKLEASDISWEGTEKTYDGSPVLEARGTVRSDKILEGDQVTVSASAAAQKSSAGTWPSTLSDITVSGGDDYEMSFDTSSLQGPSVEISRAPLDVSVKGISTGYASEDWKSVCGGSLPGDMSQKDLLVIEGVPENGQQVSAEDLKDNIAVHVKASDYGVGVHEGAVSGEITSDQLENYTIRDAGLKAALTVTAQDTEGADSGLWGMLELDKENSCMAYAKDGSVYVSPDGTAAFKTAGGEYRYAAFEINGKLYEKAAGPFPEAKEGPVKGGFYLYNDEATRTDASGEEEGMQANTIPENALIIDSTSPSVSFNSVEGLDVPADLVPFDIFMNDTDNAVDVEVKDGLSGLAMSKYQLIRVTDDEDALEKLSALPADSGKWKDIEEGIIAMPENTDEGYYIIAVLAADNVGNTSITASNGIIVDRTLPGTVITGISEDRIYNGDAEYTVNVSDPGIISSGIGSVEVEVTMDGEEKPENDEAVTDSFIIDNGQIEELYKDTGRSIASLRKRSQVLQIPAVITSKGVESNNIKIEAVSYDMSGNAYRDSKTLMMDTAAPRISGSWNTDRNGRYFTSDRVLTIDVNDMNYDEGSSYITIWIDGAEADYSISEIENGRATGVGLVSSTDTQSGRAEKELTKDREIEYKISFSGEHSYRAAFTAADRAGNTASSDDLGDSFIIDKTSPSVSVSFTGADPSGSRNSEYVSGTVQAEIEVSEKYFRDSSISVDVTALDASGDSVKAGTGAGGASDASSWSGQDGTYTYPLSFTKDANYSLSVSVTDPAGNSTSTSTWYFTIDREAPSGSLALSQAGTSSALQNYFRYGVFTKTPVEINGSSSDSTSGVDRIDYYVYNPGRDESGRIRGLSEDELRNVNWRPLSGGAYMSPDSQGIVYARMTDRAGNVSYVSSDTGVIVETTSPSIKIAGIDREYYNDDVPVSVTVTEPVRNETYSGISSVRYTVASNGRTTQERTMDAGDASGRTASYSFTFDIDAEKNNSDSVVLTVESSDNAGNTITEKKELKIDNVRPEIEAVYDDSDAVNGEYYRTGKTVTFTVQERNFDPALVKWDISSKYGSSAEIGGWRRTGGSGDKTVYTCIVTLSKDDDYTIGLSVTDKAGNRTEYSDKRHIIIDTAKPVMKVEFDNNAVKNSRYYNRKRTARITVRERNFDSRDFVYDIKASLAGKNGSAPEISRWTADGDTHTATVSFADDGTYSFTAAFKDRAGNSAGSYEQKDFVIDTKAPSIKISGIKDKSAYNKDISAEITVFDLNYLSGSLQAVFTGSAVGEVKVEETRKDVLDGEVVVLGNIEKVKGNDDLYTLTVMAKDLAGNETTRQVTFSVNRFGSVFSLENETSQYIEAYYNREAKDIIIYETNIDALTEHTVTVTANGEVRTLEEGRDYKFEITKQNGSWTVCRYTVYASNFGRPGLYEIKVSSKDNAGNVQDNTTKNMTLRFIIDTAAPVVNVTDLEDNMTYDETSHSFQVDAEDDYELKYITVKCGGKVLKPSGKDGRTYTLKQDGDWQNIEISAGDAAGNVFSAGYHVLVTADRTRLFLEKAKPFMIGGGSLILLLLLIAALKKAAGGKKAG